MKRILLALSLLLPATALLAQQPFTVKNPGDARSFNEQQRQYNAWKDSTDLKTAKHWKAHARWMADEQLHLNANGEPGDPAAYIAAVTEAAAQKQAAQTARFSSTGWYPFGPDAVPQNNTGYMENGIGRINCIAFHPTNANTYFVGVAQGGVWKTTDNGVTWTPLTDNLPITRISDIAIDPQNPNTMYISVSDYAYIDFGNLVYGRKRHSHYGIGVYKTTDGGITWQPTGLTYQLTDGDASLICKILVHPSNTNTLLACGVSGMFRSTDGGTTWSTQSDSLFWDLIADPSQPNVVYAATGWLSFSNIGTAAIYKSTDFGVTWNMLNTGIPATGLVQRIKLAIAPSDNNRVYALAVDQYRGFYGMYKSVNAGSTWTFLPPLLNILEGGEGTGQGGQGTYDLALLIHPTNADILYTGGVNLWGSVDGGVNFNPVSHWTTFYGPTVHADVHFLARQSLTGNIFCCNDGGLYRTSNILMSTWVDANNGVPWPTQWTNISNGTQTTSFYRLSAPRNGTVSVVAGAQDNATFYYDGANWSTVYGGDGMDNLMHPTQSSTFFASSQFGNFDVTYDGQNFNGIFLTLNGSGEWVTPITQNAAGTVYIGFRDVAMSTDFGNSWTQISTFPQQFYTPEISAIAASNSNAQTVIVSTRVRYEYAIPSAYYITTNNGGIWTTITGLPDSLYCTGLEFDENNSSIVYACFAGFSAGNKVFRSTDGGASWTNVSYNLPNIPVNCIKHVPTTGGKMIIATDIGVYTLMPNATQWQNESTGLPNVITSDIEIDPSTNTIYLSTFGRGIWAAPLSGFTSAAPVTVASPELFPSLNNGAFTIQLPETLNNKTLTLDIIDVMGRTVSSQQLNGDTRYDLNLVLAPGQYAARISGNNYVGVKQFVVQ
ncbi:MAG: T9SS type A sorting domain-containing protein [Bacteroidia bacterium]|jgi:photosystem II stability/assembly factor-like uncharacterized protein|nr:T9SS type A sorting domain-containing protein [Bacteroidia bacterium]